MMGSCFRPLVNSVQLGKNWFIPIHSLSLDFCRLLLGGGGEGGSSFVVCTTYLGDHQTLQWSNWRSLHNLIVCSVKYQKNLLLQRGPPPNWYLPIYRFLNINWHNEGKKFRVALSPLSPFYSQICHKVILCKNVCLLFDKKVWLWSYLIWISSVRHYIENDISTLTFHDISFAFTCFQCAVYISYTTRWLRTANLNELLITYVRDSS